MNQDTPEFFLPNNELLGLIDGHRNQRVEDITVVVGIGHLQISLEMLLMLLS